MKPVRISLLVLLTVVELGLLAQAGTRSVQTHDVIKGSGAFVEFGLEPFDCLYEDVQITGSESATKAEPGAPERSNTVYIVYNSWSACNPNYAFGSVTVDGAFDGQKTHGATITVNSTITITYVTYVWDPLRGTWNQVDISKEVPLVIDLTFTASGEKLHGTSHSRQLSGSTTSIVHTKGDFSGAVATGHALFGDEDLMQGYQPFVYLTDSQDGYIFLTKYSK